MQQKEIGNYGESLAGKILEQKGYVILDRNFRTRYGEVDLVAKEGEVLVFVEVKARRSMNYGSGAEAVTRVKQQRLIRTALHYMFRRGWQNRPCRFDLLELNLDQEGKLLSYQLLQNAFVPERGKNC
ncbi:MAG: YraN family protein [Firmicutes bacterium]|jgi:putative endonuclease|nr:YraN family protein [Bacillota bacterium]